jgi:RimJ/RimL family protein N-acetyltransferase
MSTSILDRLANGGEVKTIEAKQPIADGKGSIEVIPYNASQDPNADKFLPWFWNRLRDDGLISLYFPGAEKTGFAKFVSLMSGDVRVLLVVKKNEQGDIADTVGFATIGPMAIGGTMAAYAGFIFLKDYWDRTTTYAAAKTIMDAWFTSQDVHLDVIVGVVADTNVLAKRFLQRVGWKNSGSIPFLAEYEGNRCDATFWYITRELWEALRG